MENEDLINYRVVGLLSHWGRGRGAWQSKPLKTFNSVIYVVLRTPMSLVGTQTKLDNDDNVQWKTYSRKLHFLHWQSGSDGQISNQFPTPNLKYFAMKIRHDFESNSDGFKI